MSEGLSIRGVSLRLGGRPVLEGVDLDVPRGEVVGLLGPNGAGKTSLVRVASRTLAPDTGEVRLGGRPVTAYTRRALARELAVVPQETAVAFPFRAGELVLLGRAPHQGWLGLDRPEDVRAARAAMERLGIAALADRSVLELSGGERQLVALARGLAQGASWLLLDEPTAHLDLRHRVEVLRAVRAFAEAGGGVLLVSHDLVLSAEVCDRVALLSEGRIAAHGAPREVLVPEHLRRVFAIDAQVLESPSGAPIVLPRLA